MVELELAKEYELRVKEMSAQEQQAALAAAHAEELRGQRQLLEELGREMEDSLSQRDKQLQHAGEKHQVNLALPAWNSVILRQATKEIR